MVSKEAEITAMRDCKTHIENETAHANYHDILFSCCYCASAANKGEFVFLLWKHFLNCTYIQLSA